MTARKWGPRWAKARDFNEKQVIALLRLEGFAVWPMDIPCDLLAARRGRVHCIEVKNPDTSKRPRLTPLQVRFRQEWADRGCIHTGTDAGAILAEMVACESGHRST